MCPLAGFANEAHMGARVPECLYVSSKRHSNCNTYTTGRRAKGSGKRSLLAFKAKKRSLLATHLQKKNQTDVDYRHWKSRPLGKLIPMQPASYHR